MRQIQTLLLGLIPAILVGAEGARAEQLRLDLTEATQDWYREPLRRDLSGWSREEPPPLPGMVLEFGRLGVVGENGRLDGRLRFGTDGFLRLSVHPRRALLRFKQRF